MVRLAKNAKSSSGWSTYSYTLTPLKLRLCSHYAP
jgi:hypothetical protein